VPALTSSAKARQDGDERYHAGGRPWRSTANPAAARSAVTLSGARRGVRYTP